MIPDLLWRCPVCATNDALVQKRRLFRSSQVLCTHCDVVWKVWRVVGDDYWLTVVANPSSEVETEIDVGTELPLARWYARMKQTMALVPTRDASLLVGEGEQLYLASGDVSLIAEADDPLFFGGQGDTRRDKQDVKGRLVGLGRFFLTSRRLVWRGEDDRTRDFPLERLNSIYALFNAALVIMHEMRLYRARFLEESLLKWVTYFAYVAEEVEDATGHRITTSNF
jgi:hypothetical protein